MSKKKVLLRGVFINRDTNGEGVLKVGTTLIRVSTVMGILYIQHKRMEMLNGMFGKMAEESIYQRKMIKKSEILSIKNIWSFI